MQYIYTGYSCNATNASLALLAINWQSNSKLEIIKNIAMIISVKVSNYKLFCVFVYYNVGVEKKKKKNPNN